MPRDLMVTNMHYVLLETRASLDRSCMAVRGGEACEACENKLELASAGRSGLGAGAG